MGLLVAAGQKWSKDETLMAWLLYMELPEKEIDDKGEHIIKLAHALGRTPNSVALKAWNIAAHDERRLAKGKVGMSHGSKYDQEVWEDFEDEGDALIVRAYELLQTTLSSSISIVSSEKSSTKSSADVLNLPEGKTRETLVATRVNQSYFRNRLLENYQGRCCVTGLGVNNLLIASHIKPWSTSDPATERLAPDNGLLLNALHDRAFDQGLITIDKDLRIVVSPAVPKDDAAANRFLWEYEGCQIEEPLAFKPRSEFIEYHNDVIFRHDSSLEYDSSLWNGRSVDAIANAIL